MTAKFACSAALAALFVASPALSPAWAQGGGASQTQEWEALSQRVRPAEREWDVRAGVAGVMRPTFEGSDRYHFSPLPFITVNWRDTITLGESGLSAQMRSGAFRYGVGLTFDAGRDDNGTGGIFGGGDDRLRGLGDIDFSLGVRGFATYRWQFLEFGAAVTKYTGKQNDGILSDIGVSAALPLAKDLLVIPNIRLGFADDKYMQTYFGVTALQASRSLFPAFNATGGLHQVRAGANLVYSFTDNWFVGVNAGFTHLAGDAANSPMSISDNYATALSFVGYRF
jgi:outer membrane scaffolding protein for murein synthesis (MipA/OmpV family)